MGRLYFWHDHSAFNRADGLQGMLVVRPPGTRVPAAAPRERLMMLQDWWHYQAGSMGVRLNRPFDPTKATNATGQWCWFGLPQSLLVNGRGVYPDCENVYTRAENKTMANGAPATAADLMSPTPCVAGQLGPKAAWPVCSPGGGAGGGAGDNGGKKGAARCAREEFEVAPGEAATFRIVNAAQLVYMTVCFQGHKLTLTAADGRAVAPLALGECVDVNAGQRVDVRVEAAPAPAAAGAAGAAARGGGAHWISVHGQYRKGSPSAYAVLRYKGAPRSAAPAAGAAMQPEEAWKRRWDINQTLAVKQAPRQGGGASDVPQKVDRRFIIHTTQPIMEANGLVRWALQNVAHANTPGCKALAPELHARPALLAAAAVKMTAKSGDAAYWPNTSLTGDGMGMRVVEATGPDADALLNAATPKAGLHAMTLRLGEVVEVVLQNNRAGAYGGEYNTTSPLTSARNGCEQHPFHRHGGHFFVVGMGLGQWSPDNVTTYNLVDPPARDTATLMFDADGPSGGWTAIRFKADNPGVWPLHCHILPHQHMGHAIDVIVEPDRALAPPKDLPQCPKACSYQFARFTTPLTEKVFGSAKLLAPAAANGGMGMGLGGMRRLLSQLLRRAAGAALL